MNNNSHTHLISQENTSPFSKALRCPPWHPHHQSVAESKSTGMAVSECTNWSEVLPLVIVEVPEGKEASALCIFCTRVFPKYSLLISLEKTQYRRSRTHSSAASTVPISEAGAGPGGPDARLGDERLTTQADRPLKLLLLHVSLQKPAYHFLWTKPSPPSLLAAVDLSPYTVHCGRVFHSGALSVVYWTQVSFMCKMDINFDGSRKKCTVS